MRRGFTLIELLVVLAIIGLLAAAMLGVFGAARRQARDDRRVADLFQVRQSLQLFYLKCGFYPGQFDATSKECKIGDANNPNFIPQKWSDLSDFLRDADIGVPSIPNDPVPNRDYAYRVQLAGPSGLGSTPRGQCYVLQAGLETKHKSLGVPKELDNADLTTKPNLFPVESLDCDDDPNNNYCVGNSECFYGK